VSASSIAVRVENVRKAYANHVAVRDVSLLVPTGTIFGLLGPNGAGKTTTIRMILNLMVPDAGRIEVLGHSNTDPNITDRLGYLPEERGLYRKMQVRRVLRFLGRLKGLETKDADRRIDHWLERLGLRTGTQDWSTAKVEDLSRGMQQKVQFAGTMLHDPELVILDEPFSGLDPVNAQALKDTVLDLRRDGRTVIFSTHVMEQAEQLCDRVMMIHKSKLQFSGTLAEIKQGRDFGILLDYDGDGSVLRDTPGAMRVNDHGKQAEIYLKPGCDPQDALRWLIDRVKIRRFEHRAPTLHEIFVRTVDAANAKLAAEGKIAKESN
jgi:ABC-2 type transport system ATP-binding protein